MANKQLQNGKLHFRVYHIVPNVYFSKISRLSRPNRFTFEVLDPSNSTFGCFLHVFMPFVVETEWFLAWFVSIASRTHCSSVS
jgi:hypothetical protein